MKYTDEQRISKITEYTDRNIVCDIIFDVLPEFRKQLECLKNS